MAQASTPSDKVSTPSSTIPNSYGGASANPTAQRPGTGTLDMTWNVGYGGSSAGPAFDLVRPSTGSKR